VYRPGFPRADGVLGVFCAMLAAVLVAACSPAMVGNGPPHAAIAHGPVPGETLGTGAIKVALLLPLSATGNAGQIAQAMKNAADLALREFQTAGIQILVKDDAGTAEGARAAAAQAISEGVRLILGPLFAQSVTAAASVAKPAGIPVVAFSSDATAASKGVYLLGFLPQNDVVRVVRYAAGQGKRSFAALLPNNGYGTVVEAALQKVVADAGGRVFALERYDLDRVSMQAKATAVAGVVKGGSVDAVVMPDAGDAAPFLAAILAAGGVKPAKVKFLGSGQWDDVRVLKESNLSGAWFPAPERAGFDAFAQRYQTVFGSPPLRPASLAYDATSLAAGLAARFGKEAYSEKILTNPSGFIGVDGAFRFHSNGINERGLAIYEINHGVAQVIDPAPKNFTKAAF
jgi:ABC-type branched-subunit amino acid transport system substrate-binding protein